MRYWNGYRWAERPDELDGFAAAPPCELSPPDAELPRSATGAPAGDPGGLVVTHLAVTPLGLELGGRAPLREFRDPIPWAHPEDVPLAELVAGAAEEDQHG